MRIGIIGSGVAGLGAALSCAARHHVTIFEARPRAGGHAATVDIDYEGRPITVDTGFIVYNPLNYPNLCALFDHFGVETKPSTMSFAVSSGNGRLEWCGRDEKVLGGLFAQWRNLARPSFLTMLGEILRFQRVALADRAAGAIGPGPLGSYLDRHRFSAALRGDYLLPMGAAIWSMPLSDMLEFPAESFIAFLDNHRLLHWGRPRWRTVVGGSRTYVDAVVQALPGRLRLGCAVARVRREASCVSVIEADGSQTRFDHIILATSAPEALALIEAPSEGEHRVLGSLRTLDNAVVLHRDPGLMPRRKAAWGAWNAIVDQGVTDKPVCVSYWMNALQGIDPTCPLFITLNPPRDIDPALVFARYTYAHPLYDAPGRAALKALPSIQAVDRLSFAGAWTAHGFHEDGLTSGLDAGARLGGSAPWQVEAGTLEAA